MSRRRGAEASRRRQNRFRHLLVKRDGFHGPKRLPSTSCPLGVRFRDRLERGPATGPRVLPPEAGFRRSFAPHYDEEGLDLAAFASSSLASARCHAPLVDFCNRNDPQARPIGSMKPASPISHPVLSQRARTRKTVRRLLSERRSRVVTGQGLDRIHRLSPVDPQRLSPRLRAARASPQPDWLGHLLSRARDLAGRSGRFDRSNPPDDTSLSRSIALETRFRFVSRRAASCTLPRRRMHSAAPEVPSFAETPLRGGPSLHNLSPACGVEAERLCYPREFTPIDVR
jgi:hypothetical protein